MVGGGEMANSFSLVKETAVISLQRTEVISAARHASVVAKYEVISKCRVIFL